MNTEIVELDDSAGRCAEAERINPYSVFGSHLRCEQRFDRLVVLTIRQQYDARGREDALGS